MTLKVHTLSTQYTFSASLRISPHFLPVYGMTDVADDFGSPSRGICVFMYLMVDSGGLGVFDVGHCTRGDTGQGQAKTLASMSPAGVPRNQGRSGRRN